jgi:hypothetical protein
MAEVTLSDYLAYVFQEISRARDMADRYSKEIAQVYAKDDVLRHFSVPRFKIAKMDLTMPVMVSQVQVASLAKFSMGVDELKILVRNAAVDLVASVGGRMPKPIRTEGLDVLIEAFHRDLMEMKDGTPPEKVVKPHWIAIVEKALTVNGLTKEGELPPVADEALSRTLPEMYEKVKANITIAKTTLQSLLVNPETNLVRNGSSDATVFTMRAELVEEGVFIRSVRDQHGTESRVVDFD